MSKQRLEQVPDGFVIQERSQPVATIRWVDVDRVEAYKRDDVTFDTVCLDVQLASSGKTWTLDDDIEGFWELAAELKKRLPGVRPDWEEVVVKPPFAQNRIVLYPGE